jgi:hypothetical protein
VELGVETKKSGPVQERKRAEVFSMTSAVENRGDLTPDVGFGSCLSSAFFSNCTRTGTAGATFPLCPGQLRRQPVPL